MTPSSPFEVHAQVDVHRPATEVWAVLADYTRDPSWRAGVLSMTPEPAGAVALGTTATERIRFGGRVLRNVGVVEALDPGRRFAWRTTSGVDAEGSRAVEPVDANRSRVRLVLRIRPRGAERFYAGLAAVVLRRRLRGDAHRLRRLLEAVPDAAATAR